MNISGFDADAVRAGIATAMMVGIPADPADRVTFTMSSPRPDWVDAQGVPIGPDGFDDDGNPFDPAARQVPGSGAPVTVTDVTYGAEYFDSSGLVTRLGDIAVSHLVVTVFDTEYVKIRGCTSAATGGDRYVYRRTEPPAGLGTVTFYRLHFDAVREQ